MTNLQQAAQQALEALDGVLDDNLKVLEASISGGLYEVVQCRDAITALRTALEQQAEPTCPECKAAVLYECIGCSSNNYPPQQQAEPVAQREWVGLTKQDMPSGEDPMFDHLYFIAGMVYAEKVLKKKNT